MAGTVDMVVHCAAATKFEMMRTIFLLKLIYMVRCTSPDSAHGRKSSVFIM
ncbi:hypothetical protein [Candidatus Kuenenia stuttgartensis]|uniref:hypothetical protein n=1 Tax=Kuenenia stuttgartiensis TaxID=174633 RepID=UPI003B969B1A